MAETETAPNGGHRGMRRERVSQLWREEAVFFEVDKSSGALCLGSVCVWENNLILETSLSASLFLHNSLESIESYLHFCRYMRADFPRKFPSLQICRTQINSDGVHVVCLKTFWLREFQRKCRREWKRRQMDLDWRRNNIVAVLRNTELYGTPRAPARARKCLPQERVLST